MATFVNTFAVENFQKSPNLVILPLTFKNVFTNGLILINFLKWFY